MIDLSLLVLTGISGAGKSTAANVLEDLGYYTIDNVPLVIYDRFIEVMLDANLEANKIALVIDARSRDAKRAANIIRLLKEKYGAAVLYLDAEDDVVIRRYKETRRKHPLGDNIVDAIREERAVLADVRDLADVLIDTSHMNVHQLSATIEEQFRETLVRTLYITVQSFGFKHGLPTDSDLIFDARFLKNPHFVDDLRNKTGIDPDVAAYVESDDRMGELVERLTGLLDFVVPQYVSEGKRMLTISIGCTGGRHRSVVLAEMIGKHLGETTPHRVSIKHRDIER